MDTIEAVFEHDVFKPLGEVSLAEGQNVFISIVPRAMTREQAEAELAEWGKVYEGLTDQDIEEIGRIALDRSRFMRSSDEGAAHE